MKLAYVDLCGFRGYRKPLRIDFADGFTIIDGRNGVGKSTICDAVEFALTGTLGKYLGAKADGESVADYIWWSGEGPAPDDHYVEVAFRDGEDVLVLRRDQLADVDGQRLEYVVDRLCDSAMRPRSPLAQLCRASIIRDEHIAALSLDLSETERYALLHDAIGATDADQWVERGKQLAAQAKKRREAADREVATATQEAATAGKRIDELRSAIAEEVAVASAVERLQAFTGSTAAADEIVEVARLALADRARQLENLRDLQMAWASHEAGRQRGQELIASMQAAERVASHAEAQLAALIVPATEASKAISDRARDLLALAALGRRLGLGQGHCPLCDSEQSDADYIRAIALVEEQARQLNARAVEQSQLEERRRSEDERLASAQATIERGHSELLVIERAAREFEARFSAAGLDVKNGRMALEAETERLGADLGRARDDLRVVETLKMNIALERALAAEQAARVAFAKAQERLGVARRAEQRAQALHDAARRAAGETLNHRLERVLPLMAELFRRLRPHPLWGDIDYKIRGDVRRFLKLQVGDELNPQFIFSSGQRRATGLAFLLSVNLSLAWSRWRTILLDDPVQHVDDFRSVHLAEVMAQLASAGRQIVCVVEDAALADLLCRRLPILTSGEGKRITLGPDSDGALSKLLEQSLVPLISNALLTGSSRVA